ncbi:Hsp20/alpha crystallin family protein [Patescibacteria group bacterium]|nr:Hsp20/alpha crystallin family protein [Patescibacteria group bacterium]MBU4511757.1 Hsp20/alpha crystallin family protein [Patescibacteria group bacterium]
MPQANPSDIKRRKSFWKKLTGVESETEGYEQPQQPQQSQNTPEPQPVEIEDNIEPVGPVQAAPGPAEPPKSDEEGEEWMDEEYEGQLSVDVYQTANNIVIKSTIAGVKPEDIDISIQNDMITIRGQRQKEEKIKEDNYFYQECYWGGFSRSIILPVEVRTDKIDAALKDGVLTIIIPKARKSKSVIVKVKKGA